MDSRNSKKEKAQLLRQWAVEEMRFHTSSHYKRKPIPTEKEFEKLCRVPLTNIWEFLVKRIKASEHVKLVKDNIALQRANCKRKERKIVQDGASGEHESLQSLKYKPEAEKACVLEDVALLEKEVKQVSELLYSNALTYEKSVQYVRNIQRKKCLLETAWKLADEKVLELTEYVSRLDALVDSVNTKRKEPDRNSYLSSFISDSHSDMETVSCRDVRVMCEHIGQYLHSVMDPGSGTRHTGHDEEKKKMFDKVEDLHTNYTVHTLVDSLTTHTLACSKLVREDTVRVNIPSEVQDLSFSLDKKGHVEDQSKPPSMQKSLRTLLQEGHQNHLMRWSEEQNYLNDSWKIEAQLDDMQEEIHKLIVKVMGSNPPLVGQAEAYADLLLQLAAEEAVSPCLKQELQILIHKISQGKALHDKLWAKFTHIQEFKKIVVKKQTILGSVARYNTGAPSRLDGQKEKCMAYLVSRPIHSHLDLVEKMTSDLQCSLEKEVIKFQPIPFVCFLSVLLNSGVRSSVLDLSIAPSVIPGHVTSLKTYALLCEALHYPSYKSPDQMLSHLLRLQDSIQQSHWTQVKRLVDRNKTGIQDDPQYYRDLSRRSQEHDDQCRGNFLPRLARLEDLAQKWTRKVMEDIPTHLEAWWEQPGQHTTPWVVMGGLTFDQWMAQVQRKCMDRQK